MNMDIHHSIVLVCTVMFTILQLLIFMYCSNNQVSRSLYCAASISPRERKQRRNKGKAGKSKQNTTTNPKTIKSNTQQTNLTTRPVTVHFA